MPAAGRSVLVLEGGGLRGAFTAGVLAELDRQCVPPFTDVVAVSSAAPTAAYYAAGQIHDALTIWREHTHSRQLIDARNVLRRRPILDVDRLVNVFERVVPLHPAAVASSSVRLHIGVTDCVSGLPRYLDPRTTNVFELLRATMALPIAYGKVVIIEGRPSVDGGIAAPVALEYALSLGAQRVLVVLTRPRAYRRTSGWLRDRAIGLSYPKHAGIRRAMIEHVERANRIARRVDDLETTGTISVIRPECTLPAGRLTSDRSKIHATIACGTDAARLWVERTR